MTDYTNIINDLLGINDTMFAISTSNKNIDNISIRMAFDKNWHNIAEHAATAIEELQAEVDKANKSADAYRAMYFAKHGAIRTGRPTNMVNHLEFIGIEVSYPPPEVCCYPEYKGKPYFAIKYKEDGQYIVGLGTYNPEVLSRDIKEYFIDPKPMLSKWFTIPRSAREEEESKET